MLHSNQTRKTETGHARAPRASHVQERSGLEMVASPEYAGLPPALTRPQSRPGLEGALRPEPSTHSTRGRRGVAEQNGDVRSSQLYHLTVRVLSDFRAYSRLLGAPLRRYQVEPAQAILASVFGRRGDAFAVMFSRQAGKNELSAQLEAYLLTLYQTRGGQIVKAAPTFRPQTLTSLRRLRQRLDNPLTRRHWHSDHGHGVRLGGASALFFSASPGANVVGATASLLLEGDEAQDIDPGKWQKDFRPMAASTQATSVLWGTAWTRQTLLAQTMARLQELERADGRRRVWRVPWWDVAEENPAYGAYVQGEIARLGANHPLIRTQYALEEIDETGGLFPAGRRALMRGTHVREMVPHGPGEGLYHALLIDVAGASEEAVAGSLAVEATDPRDATAMTVVRVIAGKELPRYEVLERMILVDQTQAQIMRLCASLQAQWGISALVVDATGLGAGLFQQLARAFGVWPHGMVTPFHFTATSKSQLGWNFIAAIDLGRFKEYADDDRAETRQFWYEVSACEMVVQAGPGHLLKWGVWEATGKSDVVRTGHDDCLMSAALCTVLDSHSMPPTGESSLANAADVLEEVDHAGF